MFRPGNVFDFHGPSVGERARAAVADAIGSGQWLPGHVVSLRDLADIWRVRVNTLTMLLHGLELEGLLTLHDSYLKVAPLNPDELRNAWQLATRMDNAYYPGVELDPPLITAARAILEESVASTADPRRPLPLDRYMVAILKPRMSAVELRTRMEIHSRSTRYYQLGMSALQKDRSSMDSSAQLTDVREMLSRMLIGTASGVQDRVDALWGFSWLVGDAAIQAHRTTRDPVIIDLAQLLDRGHGALVDRESETSATVTDLNSYRRR